jgi:hypothetical protein
VDARQTTINCCAVPSQAAFPGFAIGVRIRVTTNVTTRRDNLKKSV